MESYLWLGLFRRVVKNVELNEIQKKIEKEKKKKEKAEEWIKEMRARETLRRVLGDDKYQQFLRNGFVAIKAKSGLVYQIFPAHGITAVWKDGQMVDRLCVVLRGKFPPTDSLIMRYLLILNDEKEFRGFAIKQSVYQKPKPKALQLPDRSLPELFREMKVA